jgi:hypothetical protein
MGKLRIKLNYRRRVLRLPDLDHRKLAVLNSLGSDAGGNGVSPGGRMPPRRIGP